MTHAEIRARLERGRGPIDWGELSDLVLADIWYRMLAYRTAKGIPMPSDDLRPRLVDAPVISLSPACPLSDTTTTERTNR